MGSHVACSILFEPFHLFRKHEETGGVGIEVDYDDGVKVFTPEQIVACMLTKVRWEGFQLRRELTGHD